MKYTYTFDRKANGEKNLCLSVILESAVEIKEFTSHFNRSDYTTIHGIISEMFSEINKL